MRDYDAVIFGATGFTGRFIAVEWAKRFGAATEWAIAGRSKGKLEEARKKIISDVPGTKDIPIIIADALDESKMIAMCKSTQLVINCTGPFRLFGEPLVRACSSTGTHYVDICGEPQFIETMMQRYNEDAKKSGAVIVSACGFDSVPSDMGTVFTTQQFPPEGCCSSVEAFISVEGKRAHATTYECVVLGLAAATDLQKLRKSDNTPIPFIGPKLIVRSVGFDSREQSYFVKFPGADASIVRNSQRFVSQNSTIAPVRFAVYVGLKSAFSFFYLFLAGVFLMSLGKFQWGRDLLIKYPHIFTFGLFTHEGPTEEEMSQSKFSFRFYGKGYKNLRAGKPDWEVVTRVDGPDPGYVATSRMVTQCAKIILDGNVKVRGVVTTASAFRDTPLIEELHKNGITFTVEKSHSI
ncbi:Aste57867_24507 [Aphanomyces stellatus]|uniref:Aste57867_24507 protein n=1 Tax=Aphanomyces stellatus TaxID=120398 RepID=A0A485LRN1_9STRA|nr:hypothetical protein As57867_024430 [Aphanomyces stellatus]VFU01146.1 Aste57867_24507 [Aphanomyces stellatus]